MMKNLVLLLIINFSLSTTISGQNENDIWVTGMQRDNVTPSSLDTGLNKYFGANIFDFRTTPHTTSRYAKSLGLSSNILNMCDHNGDLLFYSNGSKVFNNKHKLIENGDSLNYTKYWDREDSISYYYDGIIGVFSQSILCIPHPYNLNKYYLVSTFYDWGNNSIDKRAFTKIMYSILDMSKNGGEGKLIVREKTLAEGNFAQGVYGCKHANGKDWWLYVRSMGNTNEFYKMRIDKNGISLDSEREKVGYALWSKVDNSEIFNVTGGNFSHNGKHFAFMSYKGLELFDFDRCLGSFSNPQYHDYPMNDTNYNQFSEANISQPFFSSNSKLIYYVYSNRIYQYKVDTSNFQASQIRVASYDGFKDHFNNDTTIAGFPTYFSTIQLARDGKMYLGTGSGTRYMHTIENPNSRGLGCNVKQHSIKLKTYNGGVPYYPTYILKTDTANCPTNSITDNKNIDISIYPNPTSDYITIINYELSITNIDLYNALGQILSINPVKVKVGYQIDVSDLPSGIYHLSIKDREGAVLKREKIVVQR